MENKYFTPEIEDIRVGYECEMRRKRCTDNGEDCELLDFTTFTFHALYSRKWFEEQHIRVPYLTKEQIEKEGWKPTFDFNRDVMGDVAFDKPIQDGYYGKYRIVIVFHPDIYNLKIYIESYGRDFNYVSYRGSCKDINTFRMICKLLGI